MAIDSLVHMAHSCATRARLGTQPAHDLVLMAFNNLVLFVVLAATRAQLGALGNKRAIRTYFGTQQAHNLVCMAPWGNGYVCIGLNCKWGSDFTTLNDHTQIHSMHSTF